MKIYFLYLGPLIDQIVAVCQSKEEQTDWIQKINKQLGKTCAVNTTPNKSVSLSLGRLSDYFAHLVCKGVITRSLLKLILYKPYLNNIDTSDVVRRYAKEPSQPYSCNIKQCRSEGTQCQEEHNVSYNNNTMSLRHCSSMVLKEDGKVVYGKKLLLTPIQTTTACQDLTKSTLYKEDLNDTYNQNCLFNESNAEHMKQKHLTIPVLNIDNKDELYLSDNRDSTISLFDVKSSYCYENSCDDEKDTELCQEFQYFKYKNHNSLRSSDSGLADITIPVTQQSPLPPTETSSSNSEHLCKSSSSLHINSCIFEDDGLSLDKLSVPLDKSVTFRSELYAHWWLKKKLQGPPGSCDSGKILIYI